MRVKWDHSTSYNIPSPDWTAGVGPGQHTCHLHRPKHRVNTLWLMFQNDNNIWFCWNIHFNSPASSNVTQFFFPKICTSFSQNLKIKIFMLMGIWEWLVKGKFKQGKTRSALKTADLVLMVSHCHMVATSLWHRDSSGHLNCVQSCVQR